MALTLDVTGEKIESGAVLSSLIVDEKNRLGTQHEALRKIIEQLVLGINAVGQRIDQLQEGIETIAESTDALEQQAVMFDQRLAECWDDCTEIRIQVSNIEAETNARGSDGEKQDTASVSMREFIELTERFDALQEHQDTADRQEQSDVEVLRRKCAVLEETLQKLKDWTDQDLPKRLEAMDDDRMATKSDLDAIRKSLDEVLSKKASKLELNDVIIKLRALTLEHEADHLRLIDAGKHFHKLDGLTDMVSTNQKRMQDLWGGFSKEAQDLREWVSAGFAELRSSVRSKMAEQDALTHVNDLRKELRELTPAFSEAMTRIADLREKAAADNLARNELQEEMEELTKYPEMSRQPLLNTNFNSKCLACDRPFSNADATNQVPFSIAERRQEEELWKDVQRAINGQRSSPHSSGREVLKYVAIHVGKPARQASPAGSGVFESRDPGEQPFGGHALVRAPGGTSAASSRPQTHDASARSTPRGPGQVVHVPPRRNFRPRVSCTPRDGNIRKLLQNVEPLPALPPIGVTATSSVAASPISEAAPEVSGSTPRRQPAAHGGAKSPPQRLQLDTYGISNKAPVQRSVD